MKIATLLSVALLSALTQWPQVFATDTPDMTQPFTAAPHIATFDLVD